MKRIIAIAQRRGFKKHDYNSCGEISSDDEEYISQDVIGNIYNKKYIVLKYLNKGSFCRVWLVYSIEDDNFYAMKIQDNYSAALHERSMFDKIGNDCPYVMKLHDSFDIERKGELPIICFVCELLGKEIFELFNIYRNGLPIHNVKRIMIHMLKALEHIHHTCNVVHTDLKMENILCGTLSKDVQGIIDWFRSLNPKEILTCNIEFPKEFSKNKKIHERKIFKKKAIAKLQELVRKYFESNKNVDNSYNNEYNHITSYKLCDFGNCCSIFKHITEDVQTRQYRAPEVIIGQSYNTKADIWSLGCILYELLIGEYLFNPQSNKNKIDRDRKHIALMYSVLGEMPKYMSSQCNLSDCIFDKKGRVIKYKNKFTKTSLEELLSKRKDLSEEDISLISDLLKEMLDYNWISRFTAKQCLEHKWLNNI